MAALARRAGAERRCPAPVSCVRPAASGSRGV